MKVLIAILFVLALLVIGIFVDISWFLVGGIEEIVRGAQANPVSVHDIVVGSVRFLLSGATTSLTIGAGVLGITALFIRD